MNSQNERLNKLKIFFQANHRMPSYAELADLLEFKSKNAAAYLVSAWKDAGYLGSDPRGKLVPGPRLLGSPLLGTVEAGFPTPAEDEPIETVSLDEWLIGNRESSFLLRVSGESMIDAGIRPGDLVILDRSRTPKNGDIIVAQINDEWTMKYYDKRGRDFVLRPANTKFRDIIPEEGREIKIAGVVTGSVRKY